MLILFTLKAHIHHFDALSIFGTHKICSGIIVKFSSVHGRFIQPLGGTVGRRTDSGRQQNLSVIRGDGANEESS
jgi:hypothetical protein